MIVRASGARASLIVCFTAAALAVPASRAHPTPAPAGSLAAHTQPGRPRPAPSIPVPIAPHRAEAAAPAPPASTRPWWGWVLLGRLHPTVVHFPIALLTAAALIELSHVVRRRPVPSQAGTYCLVLGVAGALASVCLGTLNAGHQTVTGEAAAALERHQVMGWISTIAATAALAAGMRARRARQVRAAAAYVGLVVATSAVVSATGHLGGALVYGEDYLTGVLPWNQPKTQVSRVADTTTVAAPAPEAAPVAPAVPARRPVAGTRPRTAARPSVPTGAHPVAAAGATSAAVAVAAVQADGGVDFMRDVMPIIKGTCVECHGPEKVKARLRMDSIEALQKGGKSGALVKPGDPENSLMLRRVLGLDGEDQMPLDKDPLSEKQVDTLRRWIAAGATYPSTASQ